MTLSIDAALQRISGFPSGALSCTDLRIAQIAPIFSERIIVHMGTTDFLNRELARRQQRNPRYSLRAFARDLDCDHATLSQWMRGTRPMSHEAEEQIFLRLDLDPGGRARVRDLEDDDLKVLQAIQRSSSIRTHDVAAAAGVSLDRTNVALTKLLRLNVVRLEQSRWRILENVQ